MLRLTFYGGVGEIGGNKVLLEDGATRIFLDFGASLSRASQYFSGYLHPRSVNTLGDLLEFGLLPRLPGLYSAEHAHSAGLKHRSSAADAVFISHAHIDHVGYTNFLDERIPIYMGETSKLILNSLAETGGYGLGERVVRNFRTGDRIEVGNVVVKPVHVDHSIPGAYGFLVETSEGP